MGGRGTSTSPLFFLRRDDFGFSDVSPPLTGVPPNKTMRFFPALMVAKRALDLTPCLPPLSYFRVPLNSALVLPLLGGQHFLHVRLALGDLIDIYSLPFQVVVVVRPSRPRFLGSLFPSWCPPTSSGPLALLCSFLPWLRLTIPEHPPWCDRARLYADIPFLVTPVFVLRCGARLARKSAFI